MKMDVLITYDLVEGKQTEVKDAMKAKGYRQTVPSFDMSGNPMTVNLPNTTLWKANTSVTQARTDLQNVVAQVGSELERMIAVPFDSSGGFAAIQGKSYRS